MKQLTTILLIALSSFFIFSCGDQVESNFEYETKIGINQFDADSLEAAIETFTKIIDENDTCAECLRYRAFAYKGLKKYDKTLEDQNSFIQLDTAEPVGYANRASVYYMKKDYVKALADFQKALALNPENTSMYNPISHMLFATEQEDRACEYYQKAIAIGDTTFDIKIIDYCNRK